jgi:hypothetical protein
VVARGAVKGTELASEGRGRVGAWWGSCDACARAVWGSGDDWHVKHSQPVPSALVPATEVCLDNRTIIESQYTSLPTLHHLDIGHVSIINRKSPACAPCLDISQPSRAPDHQVLIRYSPYLSLQNTVEHKSNIFRTPSLRQGYYFRGQYLPSIVDNLWQDYLL